MSRKEKERAERRRFCEDLGRGEILVFRLGCRSKSGGPSKLPSKIGASRVNKPPHSI